MGEVNQTHPGNPINDADKKRRQSASVFKINYKFFQTTRYGEYTPFFVMETVPDDNNYFQNGRLERTMNMNSPKLQTLNNKKDYFNVPMEAILPLNWDKIYTNPLQGQEVPINSNIVVENWYATLKTKMANAWSMAKSLAETCKADDNPKAFYNLMRLLIVTEAIYSNGSLAKNLGYSWNKLLRCDFKTHDGTEVKGKSIDDLIDEWIIYLKEEVLQGTSTTPEILWIKINGKYEHWDADEGRITTRRFLEYLRENPDATLALNASNKNTVLEATEDFWTDVTLNFQAPNVERPQNFARLAAYQLCIAHFYTNDHIDYIYSAELYRQVMEDYAKQVRTNLSESDTFTVNGLTYRYDSLSGKNIENALDDISQTAASTISDAAINYIMGLFGFRNSLRFVDYFTGSKSQPLAVGNTEVNVNNSKVSVIDITKSIQMQRYLNSVNRAGRKFGEYVKGIFGVTPAYDFHNPEYLAHETNTINGQEIENTGAAQLTEELSTTSVFNDSSNTKVYDYFADRPGIIIGISYYDFERVYKDVTERQNFHVDRFDMFNPLMQYIGDQEVYAQELNSALYHDNFAYTTRYMEYKQRVSQAAGGFIERLPSWIYEADDSGRGSIVNIDTEYIRSSATEFDKYFVQLTGYSLGNYWHFIVKNTNMANAERPMAHAPSIL